MIKQEERRVEPILRAEKLTKRFGELTANREIDIEIHAGEIHAIAGENGAGKSTLMKMLYGVYQPTAGNLYIDGEKMERWNPTIAREKGIGMVFQDFRLVPAFTVLENVFLSLHSAGWKINKKKLRDEINRISAEYRLSVDPDTEVWKLDLGQRQHVEILKILLDPQTRVMIFDEPTSVLAPHEVQAFLQMLSGFRNKGYGIFLITHKAVRTIGGNQMAARYAGIQVRKIQTWVFLFAGALAGLAGAVMVVGVEGRMRISAGETMGFMGFLAAGMAGNNPLLLILSALLIGGLTVAGNGMEINTGLPAATMQILIMLVLLTIMTVGGKRKA